MLKTMSDLERTILRERIRTLMNDRDVLYRLITKINQEAKELDEILEFDELTRNTGGKKNGI